MTWGVIKDLSETYLWPTWVPKSCSKSKCCLSVHDSSICLCLKWSFMKIYAEILFLVPTILIFFLIYNFQPLHDAWFEYLQISGRTKHTWKLSGFTGIWIFKFCKFGIVISHVCAEEILLNKIFYSSSKLVEGDISVSLSLRVLWKLSWDVHIRTQIY